jgi:hypothetical protein
MKTALGSDLSDPALSRADNRTATSVRMVPLAAVQFLSASVGFASGSRQLSVPAFWLASKQVFLLPGIYYWSDFSLLGHFQCIINFNSKVAHSAFEFGMA